MAEGMLIALDARRGSKCIVAYKRNQLVGGYETYKQWTIPLFLFSIQGIYIPIVVLLAYGDEAFSMNPGKKARLMGGFIFSYGGIAMLLGWLSVKGLFELSFSLFLLPVLHEAVFFVSKGIELRKPIYCKPLQGIRIIEADKAEGKKQLFYRGDILLKINGHKINSVEDYDKLIRKKPARVSVCLISLTGEKRFVVCSLDDFLESRIILLPEE